MSYFFALGIDPASIRNLGVALMAIDEIKKPEIRFHTTIILPDYETDGGRYKSIYDSISDLLSQHKPSVVVMELSRGFGQSFVRQNLQESVGVMKLCCHNHNIPVVEISPKHIKLIVAGSGNAKKNDVKVWVKNIVNMDKPKSEHEADAIASVITYFIDKNMMDAIHIIDPKKKKKKKNELV